MKTLRTAFMGTPDFSVSALKALIESRHEVVCVYTQPPRPRGRGHKVQPSAVQAFAEQHGIKVLAPASLKTKAQQEEFAAFKLDVAVVAAYGLILPKEILTAPKYGCLNIHASLLPRWRGASPIQRAIWSGDKYSGITIMQMDEGLDTGPMIEQKYIPLNEEITTPALHDALADLGAELIVDVLNRLGTTGELTSTPQDNEKATYAHLLKRDDGRIIWDQTAKEISRQVRALTPWPGVWTECAGQRFKILSVSCADMTTHKEPGTILDRLGHVACGRNTVIKILRLQPDGKQSMDFISSLNGGYIRDTAKEFV